MVDVSVKASKLGYNGDMNDMNDSDRPHIISVEYLDATRVYYIIDLTGTGRLGFSRGDALAMSRADAYASVGRIAAAHPHATVEVEVQ